MPTPEHRSKYHCCATCRHFASGRANGSIFNRCVRLGYDTHPKYQFNCWDPKERVRKRMKKDAYRKLPNS